MNSLVIEAVTAEQRVSAALCVFDPDLICAVVSVLHEEVFMMTVDDMDPVIFKMGAEQAHAIVYGRILRPFVAVEFALGRQRLLRPDGTFAEVPDRPARYPTQAAALLAAEKASNRRPDSAVVARNQPYLPIA